MSKGFIVTAQSVKEEKTETDRNLGREKSFKWWKEYMLLYGNREECILWGRVVKTLGCTLLSVRNVLLGPMPINSPCP